MNEAKKLPVFFHIPKNAGTYVYNVSFRLIGSKLDVGGKLYNLQVQKGDRIVYRLICSAKNGLSDKYKLMNNAGWVVVQYDDLNLDDLNLYFVEVCSSSFGCYKEEVYCNLPNDTEPYEFLILREPYSRILSIYSYLTSPQSSHELTSGSFGDKTFIEYLNSDQLENSWLIKSFLNIPHDTIINEDHYRATCDILDDMFVSDISDTDLCLSNVFNKCYGFKNIDIPNQKIHPNKTSKKIEQPFKTLDKPTKMHFSNQTKWDSLLYEKFANMKIIDEKQTKGKVINCFYEGSNGGFGDFLRGSVNLFNHCMSNGRDFDININKHPIKKYFKPSESIHKQFDIDDLALKAEGIKHFIHSLKKLTQNCIISTKQEETKYIFSNYHPCLTDSNNIINYLNSMPSINNRCCAFLQKRLQFTDQINSSVGDCLKQEGLKPVGYNIIHFRLGDQNSFSNHGKNLEELHKECFVKCFLKSNEDDKPIIVLSDSNDLKKYLKENNKSLPIHILHLQSNHMQSKPSGFSGEIKTTDDGVFHAVFDMKLITLANSVESYSVYKHGSGFIYWIAKIFGVPVKLNLINA